MRERGDREEHPSDESVQNAYNDGVTGQGRSWDGAGGRTAITGVKARRCNPKL